MIVNKVFSFSFPFPFFLIDISCSSADLFLSLKTLLFLFCFFYDLFSSLSQNEKQKDNPFALFFFIFFQADNSDIAERNVDVWKRLGLGDPIPASAIHALGFILFCFVVTFFFSCYSPAIRPNLFF